jgi:cell division inhibitor SepF
MWRKTMLYLGLGPDDEYDDYEVADERPGVAPRHAPPEPPEPPASAVRPLPREREPLRQPGLAEPEQPVLQPLGRPRTSVVRPLPPQTASAKPYAVTPTSFNEAQEVADKYLAGTPVIMNLQEVDRDLSRRLVDFASGLCYGLRGSMERVTNGVYLLTPTNVEVSAEERRRLQERA